MYEIYYCIRGRIGLPGSRKFLGGKAKRPFLKLPGGPNMACPPMIVSIAFVRGYKIKPKM